MKAKITLLLLLVTKLIFGQMVIIQKDSAGVEILPSGIRGGFVSKTTDSTNIAIGKNALLNNTLSHRNIAIGIDALKLFNAPNNNLNTSIIAIGHGALAKYNTTGNNLSIVIGKNALGNITQDGSSNIVIGHFSSPNNRGDQKIVIGNRALSSGNSDTDSGTFIGHGVAFNAPAGTGNTVIGLNAMQFGGRGKNTIVGDGAGGGTSTSSKIGEGNVMLGFRAGELETGNDKLYIENSNSLSPLIGGDFSLNRVGVNRTMSLLNSTNRTLQIEGSVLLSDTLQIPHGSGLGKVLTSDALGNAIWQNPGGTLWTQTGGFIENTNANGFWSRYSSALPVTADNTTNPPTSPGTGNGTRMAWIPSRSAFHGGTFNMADGSVRFISENIGLFSFCYGLNSESRSRGGVAIGVGAIADGTSNTLAFGENVNVRGQRNIGFGFGNEIQDGSSNTIAMGEGITNTGGEYVNSMGWGLKAAGYGTTFLGTFNASPTGSLNSWQSTDPLIVIGNGELDGIRSNALTILKNGNLGLGVSDPGRLLQIRKGVSGVTPNTNGQAFFESNTNIYLGFGVPNNRESGILFGRPDKGAESGGIIYSSNKAIIFRTLANNNRMIIDSLGNVGIGTLTPAAKFDVKGTVKIGANGTELVEVIRASVGPLSLNINSDATATITYTVANVQTGSSIVATPAEILPAGVIMDAYCTSAKSITVRFYNASASVRNITNLLVQLTIIR